MEINIDLDLQGLIASAVSVEKIQPLLDKAISNAIASAINDATGYSSPFSKALKLQLTEAIPHGLSVADVAKFQHVLNAAVADAVHGANAGTIGAALNEAVKHVIPAAPRTIKLSDLMKSARDAFHKEENEAFYAHLELFDYGGGRLYLDDDSDTREKYRADISVSFSKDGDVYALHLGGRDITPKSLPTAIGKFDGILLSMYVGRTSIEIDQDESEVRYAAEAQYD